MGGIITEEFLKDENEESEGEEEQEWWNLIVDRNDH